MTTNKPQKLISTTSGFENIGKFYTHIMNNESTELKSQHRDVYLMLVKYSFGYTNNIQYEIKISRKQMAEDLNISPKTLTKVFDVLERLVLIKRIKWQTIGPKQSYKYSIVFPKEFHISTKAKLTTEQQVEKNEAERLVAYKKGIEETNKLL